MGNSIYYSFAILFIFCFISFTLLAYNSIKNYIDRRYQVDKVSDDVRFEHHKFTIYKRTLENGKCYYIYFYPTRTFAIPCEEEKEEK